MISSILVTCKCDECDNSIVLKFPALPDYRMIQDCLSEAGWKIKDAWKDRFQCNRHCLEVLTGEFKAVRLA